MEETKTQKIGFAELNNLIDYARASDNVYLLNKLLFIMDCFTNELKIISQSTSITTYPTF